MSRSILTTLLFGALCCLPAMADISTYSSESTWQVGIANRTLIDFDNVNGAVTNQYAGQGVTFYGIDGGSPKTTAFWPLSSPNVMYSSFGPGSGGGGWAVDFAAPVQGIAFWTYNVQFAGSQITLLDSTGTLLDTYDLLATGGGHDASTWGFNGFTSDIANISRIEVSPSSRNFITHDNLQFGSNPSVIPAPGAAVLALIGLGLVNWLKRRVA